ERGDAALGARDDLRRRVEVVSDPRRTRLRQGEGREREGVAAALEALDDHLGVVAHGLLRAVVGAPEAAGERQVERGMLADPAAQAPPRATKSGPDARSASHG